MVIEIKKLFVVLIASVGLQGLQANPDFAGRWVIDKERSTAFDPWSTIVLEVSVEGDHVAIDETLSTGRRKNTERYSLEVGDSRNVVRIGLWTGNRHIGAYIGGDGTMVIDADWADNGQTLVLDCEYVLATSQGETPSRSHKEFRISADGDQLTMMELRSSRPRPILYVFKREE